MKCLCGLEFPVLSTRCFLGYDQIKITTNGKKIEERVILERVNLKIKVIR